MEECLSQVQWLHWSTRTLVMFCDLDCGQIYPRHAACTWQCQGNPCCVSCAIWHQRTREDVWEMQCSFPGIWRNDPEIVPTCDCENRVFMIGLCNQTLSCSFDKCLVLNYSWALFWNQTRVLYYLHLWVSLCQIHFTDNTYYENLFSHHYFICIFWRTILWVGWATIELTLLHRLF
jgi:hypothetical protein